MAADVVYFEERRFRAMGSDCHLAIVGGSRDQIEDAVCRVDELEQRWSRFIPTSEISMLNARAGTPMVVSGDTLELVSRAVEAGEITHGGFEPTVLGDVIRAGYDRPFEQVGAVGGPGVSGLLQGPITVIGPTVVLAPGTGFDPGGIGKGLAADLVCHETMAAGAVGVCVNLGGDVRVSGVSPDGSSWPIAIDIPSIDEPLAVVALRDGAVATSTSLIRRWAGEDGPRHHLIDPVTGRPSDSDLTLVSVVAGSAWLAEVHAKAILLGGSEHFRDLTEGAGVEAIGVTGDGSILASPGLARFLEGGPVPAHVGPLTGAVA